MGSGVSFHGENGTLELHNNSYKIYDNKGKLLKSVEQRPMLWSHKKVRALTLTKITSLIFSNALKRGKLRTRSIAIVTRAFCYVIWPTFPTVQAGRCIATLKWHIQNDHEAKKLWTREYEKGWQPSLT